MSIEVAVDQEIRGWLYHPKFPQDWDRHSLYSRARWTNGLAFRDVQFTSTGKPVIKIAEIKNGISGQTKFTQQTFDDSVSVNSGDMLFSWSGQPETSIDVFWWRGPQGWLNQHVFKVTPHAGLDRRFFFYILRYLNPNFVGIARNKQTTGLGHVTKRDMENIEVAIPLLPEQLAIATVLGTIDNKIEANRRMSVTLEAIAQALFQDWFVDFGPVHSNLKGVTHDPRFPASFQDSSLGQVPQGWNAVNMSEVIEVFDSKRIPLSAREREKRARSLSLLWCSIDSGLC